MDTRKIAIEYRLSHWTGIMRERKESGQSVRTYCKSAGICENVYYYWQRKLREATCRELIPTQQETDNQGLVPKGWAVCEPTRDSAGVTGPVSIEIGKCRITATADTDPELLVKVCRALMSIC